MRESIPLISILASFLVASTARATEPAMQENLKKLGVEALPMTPAEMDDLVRRETAANMEVIEAAGIKP
jgi:tripartite-type tricarboxylate transporter receptor subunit TctC